MKVVVSATRIGIVLLAGSIVGSAGCGFRMLDAPTGNALRAAQSADILTAAAAKDCPHASAEIAAAKTAGDAARAASDALHLAGNELDGAKKRMSPVDNQYRTAQGNLGRAEKSAADAKSKPEAANAGNIKFHEENVAFCRGNVAVAKEEHDQATAGLNNAKADYDAKREVAAQKTRESRAANAKLLEICPKARRGLETPDSKSRGLDIFNKTKGQHQEPGH